MTELPPGIRVAQAIGLSGAAWLAGNITSHTLITIPALLESYHKHNAPLNLITKQWKALYTRGRAQNPIIAALTAASLALVAWSVSGSGTVPENVNAAALYSAAAALTLGIVPFTMLVMGGTNRALMDRAEATWVPSETVSRDVEGLLRDWGFWNGVRGFLPLLGAFLGWVAV